MYVFELYWPGAHLESVPDEEKQQIFLLIYSTTRFFNEAVMALGLFEEAQAIPRPSFDQDVWNKEAAERSNLQRQYEELLPTTLRPDEEWHEHQKIYERVSIEQKRKRWQEGQFPQEYQSQLPHLYAKTFVYALDNIDKIMRVLASSTGLVEVQLAHQEFKKCLPTLTPVRDSAHHIEDRARGLDRNKKPLKLQPTDTGGIRAPHGALMLENVTGSRLGYTMADGNYGEVDVSPNTLISVQQVVQQLLNAFSWSGPARSSPL
jgi:hypothetical protein